MLKKLTHFLILMTITALIGGGCSAAGKAMQAPMLAPLALAPAPSNAPLVKNHFKRDRAGSIGEEALRRVLAAPVFLEDKARVGVIQVASRYNPDKDLPLTGVPAVLTQAMEDSGLFEVATEISTEWPADTGISGLRELAARYRSEYLLLYRHRFVDRSYTNGWGWMYITLLGALAVPAHTIEAVGVLEATLFDVKTGTILFTVFERVRATSDENIWYNERKLRELKRDMLKRTSTALSDQVLTKTSLLAAARPEAEVAPLAEIKAAPETEVSVVRMLDVPAPSDPAPAEAANP
jgi:hypothetical protein